MPDPASTLIFRCAPKKLPRRDLTRFAAELERSVAGGRRFICLVTRDGELRRLNRQFLGRDFPTDVLSFREPGPGGFLGEIAISADRAAEQARVFGHSLADEIRILMLHGLLHLLGMDHARDRGRMARAELGYRRELGLPAGLIERMRP
jgi:probable rRNA maturation factor